MKKLDHIGILVRDLSKARETYEALLSTTCYKTDYVADQKVHVAFLKVGDLSIELIEPDPSATHLQRFLEKRGEGIHHLAFEVTDIKQKQNELHSKGITPPAVISQGADNKSICFMKPAQAHGVLIELCQKTP